MSDSILAQENAIKYEKFLIPAYSMLAIAYASLGKYEEAEKLLNDGKQIIKSEEYEQFFEKQKAMEKIGVFDNMISGNKNVEETWKEAEQNLQEAERQVKELKEKIRKSE